ncbi:hypothetical protein PACTADRAFT_472 [Pachysolen tannophilus NRRL Y-2460]|uniref:NAD(P)-binding domain-containing protein n=1 Tax=Pachysolen tannophilus NRRL Y-2460 TaxID=669874 RepID=A0A1E4U1V1_PACTA|nr:hypothetical protein PACTADRAFT_472 [Pachysolen tannophilus NRRL Y-2460]
MSTKIAVFGATGGVCLAAVKLLLAEKKYKVSVLVRSKEKFENLYFGDAIADDKREFDKNLEIFVGDVYDEDDTNLKNVIRGSKMILSGLGALPKISFSLFPSRWFQFSQPHICEETGKIILKAVESLPVEERPSRIIGISTSGLDHDVPFLLDSFYKAFLHVPHQDKAELEELLTNQTLIPEVILVRGTLYTTGPTTRKYHATEGKKLGYTISRNDVGHFIFTQCIEGDEWVGKKPLVTY